MHHETTTHLALEAGFVKGPSSNLSVGGPATLVRHDQFVAAGADETGALSERDTGNEGRVSGGCGQEPGWLPCNGCDRW